MFRHVGEDEDEDDVDDDGARAGAVLALVMVLGHFHHKHLLNAQLFPGQAVAGLSQDARVQEMSNFVASRGGGETARFCFNSHGISWANQAWQWEMAHSCTYIYI